MWALQEESEKQTSRESRKLPLQEVESNLKSAIPTCQICTCTPSTWSYTAGVNLFVPLLAGAHKQETSGASIQVC